MYEFWKNVKDIVKDTKMFEGAISMHKNLIEKYETEINSKVDSCFTLKEIEILEEVKLDIKGESEIL